jgi:hypothetical protein
MISNEYDGVLFFFKVIILVLELQIYCSFSLHCFSLSIIIRHIKLKIYYWICFPFTSKISLYIIRFYGLEGPSQRVCQRALKILGPALSLSCMEWIETKDKDHETLANMIIFGHGHIQHACKIKLSWPWFWLGYKISRIIFVAVIASCNAQAIIYMY